MSEVPDYLPEHVGAPPRVGGRPTKRTPELDQVAHRALAMGMSYKLTAELIGIDPRTFRMWREDEDYSAFLKSGRAEGIQKALMVVLNKIEGQDLRAAQWFLEKRGFELMPEAPPDADDMGDDQVQSLASQLRICRDQMDASVPAAPTEQAA